MPLLLVGLVDEWQSGGAVLAAPDLHDDLDLSYLSLAGGLFFLPVVVGTVLDTGVLLAVSGRDRRTVLVAALLAMAAGQVALALAPGPWTLAIAITLWGTASGVSVGTAQAALVDEAPEAADRTMARWGLFGSLGDLGAPIAFAAMAALGVPWQAALLFGAAVGIVDAALVAAGPARPPVADSEESLSTAMAGALRNGELLAWLGAAAMCTLLDEIFITFASLYLRDGVGASPVGQAVEVGAFSIGGIVGLAVSERLLAGSSARAVLIASAVGTLLSYGVWMAAPSVATGTVAMLVVGACVAPMYPLCQAKAYTSGSRTGLVAAMERLFVGIDVVAPLGLAWLADTAGLRVALLVLLVQPLVVAVVAFRARGSMQAEIQSPR